MTNKKGFTTKSLHTELPQKDAYNALHMPVYDGVAFEFDTAEDIRDSFEGKVFAHAYSRTTNPTVAYFEQKLLNLTGAHAVMALSSGMAAISNALLALVEKGGNIVSSNHLFGHTYALLKETLPAWGIEVRFVDMSDLEQVRNNIDEKTRVLFFETITNPQLEILDIAQISHLAHENNVVVVADSTITPPYVFESAKFGVDVEVMSATKFMSGGAAAVGGVVIDNGLFDWSKVPALETWYDKFEKNALALRIRKEIFRHLGGCMTAHTAHYLNMGLDILALRVDRCVENCLVLGEFFGKHPKVKEVTYPGLKDNAYYELNQKQFSGKPGAVMTIDLESKEKCFSFFNQLKLVRRATNLNDNKTLIIHPESTIYCEFDTEEKKEMGIRDTMMRISVGIEDVEDLIQDFNQALELI
ncbi:aminotransferase class V-fold PLP-dependent enzyme [Plebeiibacterium sediminum]|uniref:Aminotransferase class V-fold PLP-dependent enzyme n=1 Tax=Plebeiibacterium sediminum TaxID=2992112 RepID=A0AAE3M8C9_9BACT|nr:aminotransferase class V-fold PLP-dependent enzyme [Plebeiobacterium sediminum]MCW3789049.1 aminotransferase class V-fold PLP-dependent enzyme [Plebeiobacterium sediminum]